MVSAFLGVSTVCYERWGWGKGELGEKGFGDEAGEGKLESVGGWGGEVRGKVDIPSAERTSGTSSSCQGSWPPSSKG